MHISYSIDRTNSINVYTKSPQDNLLMTMTQSFNFYKIILRGIFYLDEHNKSSNSLDNFITLKAARQKKKKKVQGMQSFQEANYSEVHPHYRTLFAN